jgi:hypothetical protein
MDHIPAEYIKEIMVDLGTGERITLTKDDLLMIKNKSADDIIAALTVDSMSNISLKLDYSAIKSDVLRGVTGFLGQHFDK